MAAEPETDEELVLLGAALRRMREARGISQSSAGAALEAKITGQGWGRYERGSAKGLLEPTVQRQLAHALGASRDELLQVAKGERRAAASMQYRASMADLEPGLRQARFPVAAGEVVISFPDRMGADDVAEVEVYLAMFVKAVRARAIDP